MWGEWMPHAGLGATVASLSCSISLKHNIRGKHLRNSRVNGGLSEAETKEGNNVLKNSGKKQWRFPLRAAVTSASLVLIGDTIAQVRGRWTCEENNTESDILGRKRKGLLLASFYGHDWRRALRMTSYGFLLYGPGTQSWYELLDQVFSEPTLRNLYVKVALNQIIVGPSVVGVIFAWNSLWQGKLGELAAQYRNNAIPTLVTGWKFWVPITLLNFWVVPLQSRVAFMSSCSIFWNFYLSSAMGKA